KFRKFTFYFEKVFIEKNYHDAIIKGVIFRKFVFLVPRAFVPRTQAIILFYFLWKGTNTHEADRKNCGFL
ncbi:MAG: hypothetical protein IKN43_13050, partial [Selenomonadaceae bacterium]|nr:hypothetical protein [Selenomonadaceae bacterium]